MIMRLAFLLYCVKVLLGIPVILVKVTKYLCCEGGSWQWVGRVTGSWARGLKSAQRLGEKLESIR